MKIAVQHAFVSRKVDIDWPTAGMCKGKRDDWLNALGEALESSDHLRWFRDALQTGKRLSLRVAVSGPSKSVKLLDIHDALAQVADELVDYAFPREHGKPIPQTLDRHFWTVEASKVVGKSDVEIEVNLSSAP